MAGPMDIYSGNQSPYHMNAGLDLSSILGHPAAIVGGFATDIFLIPRLASKDRLVNLALGKLTGGVPTAAGTAAKTELLSMIQNLTGGTSQGHVNRFLKKMGSKELNTIRKMANPALLRTVQTGRLLTSLSTMTSVVGLLDLGVSLGTGLIEAISAYSPTGKPNRRRQLELGGPFVDTRHAQTQRMRSIQAIHNTQLSTRAAMGNEAAFLHLER